jgi:hypothetical protein
MAPTMSIQDLIRLESGAITKNDPCKHHEYDSQNASGLLYRTLSPSAGLWTFSAQIRGTRTSDIVIVGEDYVQVCSVTQNATNNGNQSLGILYVGFRGRIRSATLYTDSKREQIKPEIEPFEEEKIFPDHNLVVCALNTGIILFLYLKWMPDTHSLNFVEHEGHLPKTPSLSEDVGAFITADQRSGLMVVGSRSNQLYICQLKSWEEITTSTTEWNPVKAFALIRMPYDNLLDMVFLDSGNVPERRISNTFVCIIKRKKELVVFNWHTFGFKHFRECLQDNCQTEHPFPTYHQLIIPLRVSKGFVMVCDNLLYIFRPTSARAKLWTVHVMDALSTTHTLTALPIHERKSLPLFTSWTHVNSPKAEQEIIYLVRSDGVLLRLQHTPADKHKFPTYRSPSEEGAEDDYPQEWFLSFCAQLDVVEATSLSYLGHDEAQGADNLYVTSAGGSNSQIFQVKNKLRQTSSFLQNKERNLREPLHLIETIPRISQVMDLKTSLNHEDRSKNGIFVTVGQQPCSNVSQLMYGHEAHVERLMPFGDTALTPIHLTAFQVDENEAEKEMLYLISMLDHTKVVYSNRTDSFEILNLDEPALSSRRLNNSMVQIVLPRHIKAFSLKYGSEELVSQPTGIHSSYPKSLNVLKLEEAHLETLESGTIIFACEIESSLSTILIVQQAEQFFVGLCGIAPGTDWQFKPLLHPLDYRPTDIHSFTHHDLGEIVIISGPRSTQIPYRIGWETGLEPLHSSNKISDPHAQKNESQAKPELGIESIVVLSQNQRYFVLAGSRTGLVSLSEMIIHDNHSYKNEPVQAVELGRLSVTLCVGPERRNPIALAVSGHNTFRIELFSREDRYAMRIAPIYFDSAYDSDSNSTQPYNPVIHLNCDSNPWSTPISVFAAGDLIQAQLNGHKAVFQRGVPLTSHKMTKPTVHRGDNEAGTPYLISELEGNLLAVAATRKEAVDLNLLQSSKSRQNRDEDRTRWLWRSVLYFVDRSISRNGPADGGYKYEPLCIPFSPGERVTAVTPWHCKIDGGEEFKFVIIGTSSEVKKDAAVRKENRPGRLYFTSLIMEGTKLTGVKIIRIKYVKHPITGIAVMSPYQIAITTDQILDIMYLHFVLDAGEDESESEDELNKPKFWSWKVSLKMLDTPVHVTANFPCIYVSTVEKSLMIYGLKGTVRPGHSRNGADYELMKVYNDPHPHPALSHLVIPLNCDKQYIDKHTDCPLYILQVHSDRSITLLPHPKMPLNFDGGRQIGRHPFLTEQLPIMLSRLAFLPDMVCKSTKKSVPSDFPAIIGSSPNGGFASLQIITRIEVTRLLQFFIYLLRPSSQLRNLIDGDTLAIFARLSVADIIVLLTQEGRETIKRGWMVDYGSRVETFRALVGAVLEDHDISMDLWAKDGLKTAVLWCLNWLDEVLVDVV